MHHFWSFDLAGSPKNINFPHKMLWLTKTSPKFGAQFPMEIGSPSIGHFQHSLQCNIQLEPLGLPYVELVVVGCSLAHHLPCHLSSNEIFKTTIILTVIPPSFPNLCGEYLSCLRHVCHVQSSHQLLKDFSLQALWPLHSPRRSLPARGGYFQVVQYLRRKRLTEGINIPKLLQNQLSLKGMSIARSRTTLMFSFNKPSTKLSTAILEPLVAKIPQFAVKACRICMFDIFMFLSTSVRHK